MHILQELSGFLTITGFATHDWYLTSRRMPADTSFSTSWQAARLLSGARLLFFWTTGLTSGGILNSCSAMFRGIPVISSGHQANTSL
ncbi:hypothetical protein HanRHA438_Chr16g0769351 [Helianthus annuus]|nr:hypothetical protein HanRHA438_Chr16g0769351 [Helianthus annuus]